MADPNSSQNDDAAADALGGLSPQTDKARIQGVVQTVFHDVARLLDNKIADYKGDGAYTIAINTRVGKDVDASEKHMLIFAAILEETNKEIADKYKNSPLKLAAFNGLQSDTGLPEARRENPDDLALHKFLMSPSNTDLNRAAYQSMIDSKDNDIAPEKKHKKDHRKLAAAGVIALVGAAGVGGYLLNGGNDKPDPESKHPDSSLVIPVDGKNGKQPNHILTTQPTTLPSGTLAEAAILATTEPTTTAPATQPSRVITAEEIKSAPLPKVHAIDIENPATYPSDLTTPSDSTDKRDPLTRLTDKIAQPYLNDVYLGNPDVLAVFDGPHTAQSLQTVEWYAACKRALINHEPPPAPEHNDGAVLVRNYKNGKTLLITYGGENGSLSILQDAKYPDGAIRTRHGETLAYQQKDGSLQTDLLGMTHIAPLSVSNKTLRDNSINSTPPQIPNTTIPSELRIIGAPPENVQFLDSKLLYSIVTPNINEHDMPKGEQRVEHHNLIFGANDTKYQKNETFTYRTQGIGLLAADWITKQMGPPGAMSTWDYWTLEQYCNKVGIQVPRTSQEDLTNRPLKDIDYPYDRTMGGPLAAYLETLVPTRDTNGRPTIVHITVKPCNRKNPEHPEHYLSLREIQDTAIAGTPIDPEQLAKQYARAQSCPVGGSIFPNHSPGWEAVKNNPLLIAKDHRAVRDIYYGSGAIFSECATMYQLLPGNQDDWQIGPPIRDADEAAKKLFRPSREDGHIIFEGDTIRRTIAPPAEEELTPLLDKLGTNPIIPHAEIPVSNKHGIERFRELLSDPNLNLSDLDRGIVLKLFSEKSGYRGDVLTGGSVDGNTRELCRSLRLIHKMPELAEKLKEDMPKFIKAFQESKSPKGFTAAQQEQIIPPNPDIATSRPSIAR